MNRKLFADGLRLEKEGELEDAAAVFQRVFDADRGNQEVVGRLLVVYRRLKDYRKELQVVEAALAAVAQRDKAARDRWISEHPGAAKLGKEVLRTLGGESLTAYGTDPLVEKLLKRKGVLERKVGKRPATGKKKGQKKVTAREKERLAREKEKEVQAREREAKEAQARERQRVREARQAAKVAERKAAAEAKRAEAEAKKKAVRARAYPSLFVVSLKYLVPMLRIEAVMEKHIAFLDKHFAAGEFLVAGQQVPETGEVIIIRARNMAAAERTMKQDPFVKAKLAGVVNIVEFLASKTDKRVKNWIETR